MRPAPFLVGPAAARVQKGVRVVVEKRREIFLVQNVRIHLDDVVSLGSFLEFEAVLSPGMNDAGGRAQLDELAAEFALADEDLLSIKKGSGTVVRSTLWAVPATVPDPFLTERCDYTETAYLLIYGELPSPDQLEEFRTCVRDHTLLHEGMKTIYAGFPRDGGGRSYRADMSNLRLGIVGVGRHGSRYARHAAHDVPGMELAAVCRRDEHLGRELAGELGCGYSPDALDLIRRDDVDAVALVTVPDLLPELIEAAVTAGKHLIVEKPVAVDLAAGRRILRAVEGSSVHCLAGHTLRFNPVCLAVRDHVKSLGRIDSIVLTQRFAPQLQLAWIDNPARSGGGNILHTGVHGFDLVPFLTGLRPRAVACTTRSTYTKRTEDNFAAVLQLDDGQALAMVSCSRSTDSRSGHIEVSGDRGQLVGDHVTGTLDCIDNDGRRRILDGAPAATVCLLLQRFAADIASGTPPTISYRDGLAAVAVADACYRSAKSGRFEEVARLD